MVRGPDGEDPYLKVFGAGAVSGVTAGILHKTGVDIDPISLTIMIINLISEALAPVQERIQSSAFSQSILDIDFYIGILMLIGLIIFVSPLIYAVVAIRPWYVGLMLFGIGYSLFFLLIVIV